MYIKSVFCPTKYWIIPHTLETPQEKAKKYMLVYVGVKLSTVLWVKKKIIISFSLAKKERENGFPTSLEKTPSK